MAKIESKRMKMGLDKWYKTVTLRDTSYYNVFDYSDGSKVITFLADEEGRVYRVILSKADVARLNGALAETVEPKPNEATKAPEQSPRQSQKSVAVPPSGPLREDERPLGVDIQDLFPGQ